jgi:hypothetical protein
MGQGALQAIAYKKSKQQQEALPVAPTADDITADPAQTQLNMLLGGRTSTVLTGYTGEDPNKLKTSKLLLGGG